MGSCVGAATLHRQGHSLLVCSRSKHKGCGFSQSGWIPLQSNWKRGNIRNEAGAGACSTSLSALTGTSEPPQPRTEGAGHRAGDLCRREVISLWAALSSFSRGKHCGILLATAAPRRPPKRGTAELQAAAPGRQAKASGHLAPLLASLLHCGAVRAALGSAPSPLLQPWGRRGGAQMCRSVNTFGPSLLTGSETLSFHLRGRKMR